MDIKDEWVLSELKRMDETVLIEDMMEYPEDEREGRTDIQVFLDEVEYFLKCFHDDGHSHDQLKDELKVLRKKVRANC